VLLANPGALQPLASIDTVVFDKTGTLTQAQMQLNRVLPLAELDARGSQRRWSKAAAIRSQRAWPRPPCISCRPKGSVMWPEPA
jgi:cation transport ATPase